MPPNRLLKRFRTEEELIEYYEMKAVDPLDEHNKSEEVLEEDEDSFDESEDLFKK